ncbi:MAG: hypothetical protein R3F43_09415 [bacterium]
MSVPTTSAPKRPALRLRRRRPALAVRLVIRDGPEHSSGLGVAGGAVQARDAVVSTNRRDAGPAPGHLPARRRRRPGPRRRRSHRHRRGRPGGGLETTLAREMDTTGWFAVDPHVEPAAGTDGIVVRAVDCAAAGIDAVVLLGDGDLPGGSGAAALFAGLATADPGVGRFARLPAGRCPPADSGIGPRVGTAGLARPARPAAGGGAAARSPVGILPALLLRCHGGGPAPGLLPRLPAARGGRAGRAGGGGGGPRRLPGPAEARPPGGAAGREGGVRRDQGRCGVARTWLPGQPEAPRPS